MVLKFCLLKKIHFPPNVGFQSKRSRKGRNEGLQAPGQEELFLSMRCVNSFSSCVCPYTGWWYDSVLQRCDNTLSDNKHLLRKSHIYIYVCVYARCTHLYVYTYLCVHICVQVSFMCVCLIFCICVCFLHLIVGNLF